MSPTCSLAPPAPSRAYRKSWGSGEEEEEEEEVVVVVVLAEEER